MQEFLRVACTRIHWCQIVCFLIFRTPQSQESKILESSKSLQNLPESNEFLYEKQLHAIKYGTRHYRNTRERKRPADFRCNWVIPEEGSSWHVPLYRFRKGFWFARMEIFIGNPWSDEFWFERNKVVCHLPPKFCKFRDNCRQSQELQNSWTENIRSFYFFLPVRVLSSSMTRISVGSGTQHTFIPSYTN